MGKCTASTPAEFKNPQDFVPVKGRSWQVYCKICTPPDRAQGQPMTIAAAVRHERENAKHKAKLSEAALWDFARQFEPDWTTPNVPQGESAWEYENCTSVRLNAYVHFWMDGIAAAERDEEPAHLDVFITKYDKEYQEEHWQEKYEDWNDEEEEEWPLEECNGVLGYWYSGGSFDPYADDIDMPEWEEERPPSLTAESIARRVEEDARWWPADPDPREGWGSVAGDQDHPWKTQTWDAAAPESQPSDATPQQASEKTPSQKNKRRRRNRGRGRGQGQQAGKDAGVPDSATRRVDAHRDRRAKMY